MGGDSVAQTPETVREQADRSAIAYRLWLAYGDGEPRTPYTSRDEADPLRDLISLRQPMALQGGSFPLANEWNGFGNDYGSCRNHSDISSWPSILFQKPPELEAF
jgi:hypothetical protein